MIDDLESEIIKEGIEVEEESTSNKFFLSQFYHPLLKSNDKILDMSTSKQFIYIITENSELIRINSKTLMPDLKKISIPSPQNNSKFKEDFTKIWSDRGGYHNIIRYKGGFFYYNSYCLTIKELKSFKNIEICAIGLDDRNVDKKNTNNFIAVDYCNNIYECNIIVDKLEKDGNCVFRDRIDLMTTFQFFELDYDEEEDNSHFNNNERVYDIKFFRGTKFNIQSNEDALYIIAVTKSRFYQFIGPGLTSFRQVFGRYKNNPSLFNDSCKYFPSISKKGKTCGTSINLLYKMDQRSTGEKTTKIEVYNQFGWKTGVGYCFGSFKYSNSENSTGLPYEQTIFTVMPFSKINREGKKKDGEEPIDILHTDNHIFLLYEDCLTVISKLTSYIIHTRYFSVKSEYKQILYNEFSEERIILLKSERGLFQISLKDENTDIWKDYLEIGDFHKAQLFCPSEKLKQRIYRIEAEYQFKEIKSGLNAANKYANSDEKFEIVCLEYLLRNDIDGLKIYLQIYKETNVKKLDEKKLNKIKEEEKKNNDEENSQEESNTNKEDILQLSLINTWIVEIFLNQLKTKNDKSNFFEFSQMIKDSKKYLSVPLIYEILQNYGRLNEFSEYSALMNEYEKVIQNYINQGEIDKALEKIEEFLSYSQDEETTKTLTKIFCDYSHNFFKKNPKKSISILQQNLKDLKMELIVHAIASTIVDDSNNRIIVNGSIQEKEVKPKAQNNQCILEYLKSLIDKPRIDQENNIHNLYLFFLSRNKSCHPALIEYLKAPLKIDENENILFFNRKKGILFNLDYAIKLFQDQPAEYSLILALMGRHSRGIKVALDEGTEECEQIAKFIASNAPGENLRKKLWIEIFNHDSQNEIRQALDIIKESKILKIEDVLPFITNDITIENFKLQISECINEYTKNIDTLKKNITDYNLAAENIKVDINKIKRKAMEIQNNNCKCEICHKPIEDRKLFLFPCGHMFDIYCMKECLLEYEITGIDYLHDKNVEIDDLFQKLQFSKERIFIKAKHNEDEFEENNFKSMKSKNIEISKFGLQRVKNYKTINYWKKRLFGLLSEQCILCGDFVVDSIQFTLDQKDGVFKPDKNNMKLNAQREFDFDF